MCSRIIFDIKCSYKYFVFTSEKLENYPYAFDIPVINYGTVVEIQSTRCNGIKECWNDIDELECDLSTSFTIFVGMYLVDS